MPDRVAQSMPFAEQAIRTLGEDLFRYILGRASDNDDGQDANEVEFTRYTLVPRVLRGIQASDISTDFLGYRAAAPVAVGAFAGDRLFHPDGLLPIARICRDLALPLMVSEETVTPLAEICAEHRSSWLQVRAAGPVERIMRLADLAAGCGTAGLVLSVLAPVHPVRGLQPGGFSIGEAIAARGWSTIGSTGPGVEPLPAFPAWGWAEIRGIVGHCAQAGLPVLLKGILHPDDAGLAQNAGASGVIASNIGLRQSARWVPALRQLPKMRAAFKGTLLQDGGVRHGADVLIALALGADLAVIVRPLISALAAGGETAVRGVLNQLITGTQAMAAWCNLACLDDLSADLIAAEPEEGSR